MISLESPATILGQHGPEGYGHDEMSARTCQTQGTRAILAAMPP